MTTLVVQIVGMHFRPPAKQILAFLKPGLFLALAAEPKNPYDSKAIKVLVPLGQAFSSLSKAKLEELGASLEGTGSDLMELLQMEELFHLGYVVDSDGKFAKGKPGNREVAGANWGILKFSPEGLPLAEIDMDQQDQDQDPDQDPDFED